MGAGRIVWIFHTRRTWKQFREIKKDAVLSIHSYHYFHNIWYHSDVEKNNLLFLGKTDAEKQLLITSELQYF